MVPWNPTHGRIMRPSLIRTGTTDFTRLIGIAKPMFCASGTIAVFMPMTSPHMFSRGPPELPGLIGASVWIKGSLNDSGVSGRMRLTPLTMPRVTVWSSPSGLPMAMTFSPTRRCSESPSATVARLPLSGFWICSTAMSKIGSAPSRRAGITVPSSSVT